MRRTKRKAKRSNGVRTSRSDIIVGAALRGRPRFPHVVPNWGGHGGPPLQLPLIDREVFGLRMVDNNSRSRLLWLQLKLFAQLHVDTRRIKQREKLLLIFEPRACRISETVARALILLLEQSRQIRRIRTGDAELFANAFMPQFSQRLRALDT